MMIRFMPIELEEGKGPDVKVRDVEAHLKKHGFEYVGTGDHACWKHKVTGRIFAVPKGREMKGGTFIDECKRHGICKRLNCGC